MKKYAGERNISSHAEQWCSPNRTRSSRALHFFSSRSWSSFKHTQHSWQQLPESFPQPCMPVLLKHSLEEGNIDFFFQCACSELTGKWGVLELRQALILLWSLLRLSNLLPTLDKSPDLPHPKYDTFICILAWGGGKSFRVFWLW